MIAAGPRRAGGDQLEQAEQRGRRIADRDDARRPAAAARDRSPPPCGSCRAVAASAGVAGSASVQMTSLPAGRRARVTPSATMRASQKIGAPPVSAALRRLGRAGREDEVARRLDHAAGMDDAHRDALLDRREAREIGLAADDGEGAAVDRGAVLFVVVARASRGGLSRCKTLSPRWSTRRRDRGARQTAARRRVARRAVDDEVVAVLASPISVTAVATRPGAALGAAADMQDDALALGQQRRAARPHPRATGATACMQAGAPGQATTRRRGSRGVGDEAELARRRRRRQDAAARARAPRPVTTIRRARA